MLPKLLNRLSRVRLRVREWRVQRRRKARLAQYHQALQALEALAPLEWPTLQARLLRRLPLPPEALLKRSSDLFNLTGRLPGDFIIMSEGYRGLAAIPAWQDFTGHLLGMKEAMEQQILAGQTGPNGEDQTPLVRAAYALLLDIIAIPDKVEQRRAYIETELMGAPARETSPEMNTTWAP